MEFETMQGIPTPAPAMRPMDDERARKQKELLSHQFAALDLNLYLDTHPYDKKALQMHADVVQRCKLLMEEYEGAYGPLTATGMSDPNRWSWLDTPSAWEA